MRTARAIEYNIDSCEPVDTAEKHKARPEHNTCWKTVAEACRLFDIQIDEASYINQYATLRQP